ncbi:hypothetical protein LEN26_004783 [Aphanomyces euteiches]|nr:hypothetical protein LEN26_004783 [Aphanomyces euteiches]
MPSSRCVHYRGDTSIPSTGRHPRSPLTSPSDAVDTLWATSVAVVESVPCVRRPLRRFVSPSDAVDALRVTRTALPPPPPSSLCSVESNDAFWVRATKTAHPNNSVATPSWPFLAVLAQY